MQPISAIFARRASMEVASANERQILGLLHRQPGASRADLARGTGLTNQSLTRIIDDLCARDLVVLGPPVARGRGQPSAPVSIRPDGAYTVGVSLMTDALSMGVMDFGGHVIAAEKLALDMNDVPLVLDKVRSFIDVTFSGRGLKRERLLGAGIGVTGYFIGSGNQVNPPMLLDGWALTDIVALFEEALTLPIWLDNDGNVAAVGESLNGVGQDIASFAYLYFSVGFGGGIVLDRQLYRGRHGNAGEFASILPPDILSPNLENLRQFLNQRRGNYPSVGALTDAFDPDAAGVSDWIEVAAVPLNHVISAISAVIDVDAVVLGGRLPRALGERLIPRLGYFNPERRGHHRPVPRIILSGVTGDAAMIGAAALPLKALFFG